MKVIALKPFIDKGVTRKPGDAFTLSAERYKEINSTKHGIMAAEVAEEIKQPKKKKKVRKNDG